MNIQKHYEKILHLKETLKVSPTISFFMKTAQEELLSVFDTSFLGTIKHTKKSLLDLLDTEQSRLSLSLQSAHTYTGLHDGKILPLKSVLEWKKREELAKSNYLVPNLELACSHPDQYFRKNFAATTTHNELIDYVVIDPNMVPQGFLDVFQIPSVDIGLKNIKDIFKKAKPLNYHKERQTTTWRVVFIDGKIVVFRTLQQLLHKEENLTAGEKKRVNYTKHFNAYDDIYTALRSQKYIVDKEQDKIDDYKDIQLQMIELLQLLRQETKHRDERRKLTDIINAIRGATSFEMMATKFYDLYTINFMNKNIDAHRLEGAGNKISRELDKLSHMILEIKLQSDALEKIIYDQEYALKMFHANVSKSINAKHHTKFLSAFDEYHRQISQIKQKTEPFCGFDQQIKQVFGSTENIARMQPKEAFLKAEILVALQRMLFQTYKLEHKIKLGEFKKRDTEFFPPIMNKHTEVYTNIFQDIDVLLKQIKTCLDTSTPDSLEKCCTLLEHMKNISWSEKIDIVQRMKIK